jgi:hypothetical protein
MRASPWGKVGEKEQAGQNFAIFDYAERKLQLSINSQYLPAKLVFYRRLQVLPGSSGSLAKY